jgi:hypothetical protein
VAVSFTDEELSPDEYMIERSPVGLVYIPLHSVELDEEPGIRYMKYPWIHKFEIDGIRPSQTCCIWQPGINSKDTDKEV